MLPNVLVTQKMSFIKNMGLKNCDQGLQTLLSIHTFMPHPRSVQRSQDVTRGHTTRFFHSSQSLRSCVLQLNMNKLHVLECAPPANMSWMPQPKVILDGRLVAIMLVVINIKIQEG